MPERTKVKEALNRATDFKAYWDLQFSNGYLNSDGRKAFIRLLKATYVVLPQAKSRGKPLLRRASENEISRFLDELNTTLNSMLLEHGEPL